MKTSRGRTTVSDKTSVGYMLVAAGDELAEKLSRRRIVLSLAHFFSPAVQEWRRNSLAFLMSKLTDRCSAYSACMLYTTDISQAKQPLKCSMTPGCLIRCQLGKKYE